MTIEFSIFKVTRQFTIYIVKMTIQLTIYIVKCLDNCVYSND